MSKEVRKYKSSEIAEMFSICDVRNSCHLNCRGCVYYHKGHKECLDMIKQYDNMSRAEQLSAIISSKILKDNW